MISQNTEQIISHKRKIVKNPLYLFVREFISANVFFLILDLYHQTNKW